MKNIIFKKSILYPSSELVPRITISPFCNSFLQVGEVSDEDVRNCTKYLSSKFSNYKLMSKGREAISVALSFYNLQQDDVVTILTTSGNYYISGCVTKEIEKKCKWSRIITSKTKIIFVNHEFGYPYENICCLKRYGFPIIEDCAHTFFTENENIGLVGDFVIYSLPKSFPMQMGAILTPRKYNLCSDLCNSDLESYILHRLAVFLKDIASIRSRRLYNYHTLEKRLSALGIKSYFTLKDGVIPSVFLFEWSDNIDYPDLKEFMQTNGVESSVFYGKNAFFIPCNDTLSKMEIEYMINLLEYYYNKLNKK